MPLPRLCILTIGWLSLAGSALAQPQNYAATVVKATRHAANQQMSHTILWNNGNNSPSDHFVFDQERQTMTVESGIFTVQYDVQIIGTYDFKDSSFLWSTDNLSIHQSLQKAAAQTLAAAGKNHWPLTSGKAIKCAFRQAKEWQILAMYLNGANGLEHVTTNNNRTAVLYLFYQVRLQHRLSRLFDFTVDTKTHYQPVTDTALISYARRYIREYQQIPPDYSAPADSARRALRLKYWDTTNISFSPRQSGSLPFQQYRALRNWHVLSLGDTARYVIVEEALVYGVQTYALEIKRVNGRPKINNVYGTSFQY